VAGLGTITPASGFVLPWHGLIIGLVAGIVCFYSCTWLKIVCGYDDSLDVFGVHGVGGATGTLLVGVFATSSVGNVSGLLEGHPGQVLTQLYGIVVTLAWSAVATFLLLKLVAAFTALRVDRQSEMEGLDVTQHGEALQ
jgi:ammonium transporter, Amt family